MMFLTILNESIKLIPKNGKLMAFIAMLSIILSSTSLSLFVYFQESLITTLQQSFMPDPSTKTTSDPAQITSRVREDFVLLFALVNAFFISLATISFFSAISTIIVSSASYTAKNLSLKELLLRIRTTWRRPLITTFYASGLTVGYFVFVAKMLTPFLLTYPNIAAMSPAIFLGVIALMFYLYLFIAWALAIVVSVLEESCYGVHALGKAAILVEGKRFHGYVIMFCSKLVVSIILQGCYMILGNEGFVNLTIKVLVYVSVSILGMIFMVVAYTVFYFECMKQHVEEMEFRVSFEYTKVPTHNKLANDIP